MTIAGPTLVLFHGGGGTGTAERVVDRARVASSRLTAARALAGGFERVLIATDAPDEFSGLGSSVTVEPDPPGVPFSFEPRLRELVARYGLVRPVVTGSGSLPLLTPTDFRHIAAMLAGAGPAAVTNNLYSSDLTGWTPGNALDRAGPFARDNILARRLRDDAGLPTTVLVRTTATQFDLDTPTDLAILALQPGLPAAMRDALAPLSTAVDRISRVLPVLCDRNAELLVAGRVGSQSWQYLERETACRVRLYSEERGLATAPDGYRARSALGFLLEAVGPARFVAHLCQLADAVLFDTRVLTAHMERNVSREDRFQADLLAWEAVTDPWLRDLTCELAAAPGTVIPGGHSLVSGGLMALNDAAWTAFEAGRLPAPDSR